jgi:hypothetical protein
VARTWLSITVELIDGRSQHLWPGSHVRGGAQPYLRQLAEAIDDAFAR